MKSPLLTGYAFNSQARTVDFSGLASFDLRRLMGIINLTARQEIYAPGDPELGFTAFANKVVTLAYDTRTMSNGDPLLVIYEDGVIPATADKQDAIIAAVQAIPVQARGSTVTADVSGSLTAAQAATPIAANLTRAFLEITNTGPNPLSYRWGAAATAVAGHILGVGQSARYDNKVPTAALSLFSTAGTTFLITTG